MKLKATKLNSKINYVEKLDEREADLNQLEIKASDVHSAVDVDVNVVAGVTICT